MNQTRITKILAVILTLAMLITLSCIGFAEDDPFSKEAEPGTRYTYIDRTDASFTISGLNSTSYGYIKAKQTCALSITLELQKLKSGVYETIATWSDSATGTSLSLTKTRLINVFATYRLKATFTAGSETVVKYAYPA